LLWLLLLVSSLLMVLMFFVPAFKGVKLINSEVVRDKQIWKEMMLRDKYYRYVLISFWNSNMTIGEYDNDEVLVWNHSEFDEIVVSYRNFSKSYTLKLHFWL
jgi:hypothetical protein